LLSALSPLTDFDFGKAGVSSWVITSVALRCSYMIFREQLNRSAGPRRTLFLSADRRRVLMLDTVHFQFAGSGIRVTPSICISDLVTSVQAVRVVVPARAKTGG
jgi:hypothetical protein